MGNPRQYIYTMVVMELLLPYHTSQLITPLEKKKLLETWYEMVTKESFDWVV